MLNFRVYWWVIDGEATDLGWFETASEAEAFAKKLQPLDGFDSDSQTKGVAVEDTRERDPIVVGPSAKWHLQLIYCSMSALRGWDTWICLVQPTGPEEFMKTEKHHAFPEYPSFYAEVYAETEAGAIQKFEDHFGVRFTEDQPAPEAIAVPA